MKIAILATVLAAASGVVEAGKCKAGTYRCTLNKKGWETCSTQRNWVYSGSCGKRNYCAFNWQNKSPYCIPKGTSPPLVKRYLMTSDTRTPAGQQSRLTSAAAPFG